MQHPFHIKHTLHILSALFVCLGLLSPNVAVAQTVTPPPPPLEQRRELALQPPLVGTGRNLQPDAVQTVTIPWSKLAFQSYRDGNWEIYAGNDDGSNLTRLTNNSATDMQPKINRGATRIAFSSKRDGDYEIFTMNMDGSGLTQLTKNTKDDVGPAWSPDGTKIAFQSYRDGQPEIYVMNADGSQQTRLTNYAGYDGEPAWSPDGTRIAYISGQNYNLYVMNANGSGSVLLASYTLSADPTWSPDGSQIAYDAQYSSGGFQWLMIYDFNRATSWDILMGNNNCDLWAGSWSPDGRYLSFTDICYTYYQGAWYWTDAHLAAVDRVNPSSPAISLPAGNTEWNPNWQSADAASPVSSMTPLRTFSPWAMNLNWSESDEGGSGFRDFEIQVKDGMGGIWQRLFTPHDDSSGHTTDTSITWHGTEGNVYCFRVRGRDYANNVEPWPADSDTCTTVESLAPATYINPLPPFVKNGTLMSWFGVDPGGSGIAGYYVDVREGANGVWMSLLDGTPSTSWNINGTPGTTYYYRVRGRDSAGNIESWPPGDGDTHTTFYSWQATGLVHDNSGAPIEGAAVSLNPAAIQPASSEADGSYTAFLKDSSPQFTALWSKTGYGLLPQTAYSADSPVSPEITLPPADDVMRDGTFEAGSLLPENWQTGGTLPVTVTGSAYHTGQFAALAGNNQPGQWAAQETLTDLPADYLMNLLTAPRLVIDSQDVTHAVWVNGTTSDSARVYYTSKAAGGTWSTPEAVSDSGVSGVADIAVDAAGTLYVAWADSRGAVYRSKPLGGAWSEAAVAMSGAFVRVSIAADGWGALHLLGNTSSGFLYTTASGGAWSTPYTIDPLGWGPTMVVDSSGTVHVMWLEGKTDEIVLYASRPRDGAWSPTTQASAGLSSYSYNLAVDDAGAVYVAWIAYGKINFRVKQPGADWGATEAAASDVSVNYPAIRIYRGRIGVSFVKFISGYTYGLYFTERNSDGSWSQPVQISQSSIDALATALAVGPDGRFSLAWKESVYPLAGKLLFREEQGYAETGDAVLSQTVTIPEGLSTPTLAFYYQLQTGSLEDGAGLKATLKTGTGDASLLSTQTSTPGWTFQTFDLSEWSGQTVTLEFRLHKAAWGRSTWALFDDVTLGSAHADIWAAAPASSGRPGDIVTFSIACGNRGGAPAANAPLALPLPAGLTFVSAAPAPTHDLTWDLGDLAAKSGTCAVQLTAQIDPSVTIPHDLAGSASITSDASELETANNQAPLVARVPYYLIYLPALNK